MPQFENPYQDKPSGARPVPGIIAIQMANMLEIPLRWFSINLYQHERDGLAHFLGAVLRAYPVLGDYFKQVDPPK